jgi:hypothetical protein
MLECVAFFSVAFVGWRKSFIFVFDSEHQIKTESFVESYFRKQKTWFRLFQNDQFWF